MFRGGEGDEGKGELALDGIWDADDTCLGDEWMRRDGLFDSACVIVSMRFGSMLYV